MQCQVDGEVIQQLNRLAEIWQSLAERDRAMQQFDTISSTTLCYLLCDFNCSPFIQRPPHPDLLVQVIQEEAFLRRRVYQLVL